MKRKTMISSILVIVLCLGLISGSTFALFTSESSVNIAVTSGKVKLTATLAENPTLYSANPTLTSGELVDKIDSSDKTGTILPTDTQGAFAGTYYYEQQTGTFANGGTATIEAGKLTIARMTPGDKVATELKITNESNVTIKYRLKIAATAEDDENAKILEVLKVRFEGILYTGLKNYTSSWITKQGVDNSETYTSKIEVIFPLDAGNEYQSKEINLAFTVEAVQSNANTSDTGSIEYVEPTSTPVVIATTTSVVTAVPNSTDTTATLVASAAPTVEEGKTTEVTLTNVGAAEDTVKLTVESHDVSAAAATQYTIVDQNNTAAGSIDLTLTVNDQVVSQFNNNASAKIVTYVAKGLSDVKVIYNGDNTKAFGTTQSTSSKTTKEAVTTVGDYFYDPSTGELVFITDHFSEYVVTTSAVVLNSTTNTAYKTLDEAISNASANDELVIINDITSENGFLIEKSLNVDTNGKTITVTNGSNVNSRAFKVTSGKLKVYGGGTIDAKGTASSTTGTDGTGCYGAFRAEIGTTLELSDLTLKNYRPWGLNVKVLGANATLDNVKIVSVCGGGIEVTDDDGANGNVTGYAKLTNCTMSQSDFRDWCSVPVSVSGNSTVDVYSTEYVGEYGVFVFSSGGVINIYGGSFTATSHEVLITTYDAQYDNDAIINVYGGTFNGTIKDVSNLPHEFINIYGGTFDHDPTSYIAPGYSVQTVDNKYVVEALFDGGSGTENDPFIISSAKQLTNINEEPDGTFFKLNNDIVVTSSDYLSVPNSVYENSTLNALISNFNNKTLDGNNHKISLSTNNSYIFSLVQNSTIKNLIVDFNNSSSSIIYAGHNYTFNNVETTGDLVFNTGNCAAFVVYSYYNGTYIDCTNKAYIHSTSGDETIYDAIFIGYGLRTGDVIFTNCKNEGTFICGKAGMFMANWAYSANLSFAITNCVNTGVIQSTSPTYYNGANNYNYCTSDYWDKAGCLKFSFDGGDLLTASTSTKWYDVTAQSSLVGWEGAFVAHSVDSTLALTKNTDGTFTITPSSKSEAAYYMVSVGTYTGIKNNGGSSRVYATENNITGTTTTLKALSFVDLDWVTAHPTAIQSTLAGNTIYTLDNVSYYLINRADQLTLGGKVTEPQMISVSVFDATGKLLSAAILGE